MSHEKILIIDDEKLIRRYLTKALEDIGYKVSSAEDGEKGLEALREGPELVICDIRLPQTDGLTILRKIHETDKDTPVIMLTADGSLQSAIESMKLGAYNYITKPFDMNEVIMNVQKALETRALKKEVNWLRHEAFKQISYDELIGSTPSMRELMKMVSKVATSDAPTVLLEGESGTGKNFVAKLIHFQSRQANFPFTEINCASLPETLIESELFGHEKGAFTDARQTKKGLFEVAKGGTVFLDEIGEMSIATQAKLLQVIEGRMFRRVGGVQDIETNARVIAASNLNLKQAVTEKKFREDLYFRLQLIPIRIPPLRERVEDIPELVQHFIKKFNQEYHKNVKGISPEAEVFLKTYAWPGNVRELKNVIERIAILENDSLIGASHLPAEIKLGQSSSKSDFQIPDQGVDLEDVEKQFILQALDKTEGNQSRAARLLGITRHTLRYRMDKFGIAN